MKKLVLASASVLALMSTTVSARDVSVALTGGTIGAGLEATTNITNSINIRGIVAGFSYSQSGSSGDVNYDAKANLFNAGVLLDYYPFETVFRLSAGAMYNGTKVTVDGKPNGSTYTLNGVTYTAAQVGTVNGEVKYNKVMPYVGFGFANPMKGSNFTFGMDIGAMIGTPDATLTATNPTNDATITSNIAVEQQKLQDDANKFVAYPVVTISLGYRF